MDTPQMTPPRTIYNFGFAGARTALAALSSLIVSLIIARSLGAANMGTYSFVIWVAGTIAALSSLGLPDAVAKYVAEHKGAGDHALAARIARTIVGMQILATGVVSIIGAGVWSILERHHLMLVFLALATVMPTALQQTLLGLMEGTQRFDLQFFATLGGAICQIGIVAAFALVHASIPGFLLANLLSSAALTGLTLSLCRPMFKSHLAANEHRASPGLSKRIFNFSISVYALWLLNLIVCDKSELVFLRAFQSPAEIAYYSVAFALTARLSTAGDSISFVLFPMFVTRYIQDGEDGLREIYRRSMRYIQMLMVPICFWGIPLAPRLVIFAYGAQYAPVASVVQVLLGTLLLTLTMTANTSAIYTMDRQFSLLHFMVLVATVNIFLDLALVPRYAALGAAFANGFSQAFAACGLVVIVQKTLPGSFPVVASLKIFLAAAISALPIFYTDLVMRAGALVLSFSVLVAALLYLCLLGGLRAITKSELEALGDGFMTGVFRKVG
jgi:O-antigen/teichoic acid export membrane protein